MKIQYALGDRVQLSKQISDQNLVTSVGIVVETAIIEAHRPGTIYSLPAYQHITVAHDGGVRTDGAAWHYNKER